MMLWDIRRINESKVMHMWSQVEGNRRDTSGCTCGYAVAEVVRGVLCRAYVAMGLGIAERSSSQWQNGYGIRGDSRVPCGWMGYRGASGGPLIE